MVAPYLPAPANTGGRIRMFRLARALSDVGPVSLYACARARDARAEQGSEELGVYRTVRTRTTDLGVVLPWLTAARVRRSCPAALVRDLRRDHARAPFDALVISHSYTSAAAKALPGVPWVLDEHNIESV